MKELLPDNWVNVPLGNIARYINGRAFKPHEWEKNGYPIIRIQNLTKSTQVVNYSSKQHEEKYFVKNGDVLMAWSATLDVFEWKGGPAWLNQHIFNVKEFKNVVVKKYLFYSLKQAIADFYQKTHGTGMVHVTKPVFEAHEIPLPPFNEQKRIVDRLDQIIPRIDELKTRLDNVPTIIKRFRQSVLTAAVTGRLTEKWREDHPDVEGVEATVQSIYYRRLAESKTDQQKNKVEKLFAEVETQDNALLPETWKYAFLNKICESFQYGTSSKSSKQGDIPVLRMGNLQNGAIDWSDLVYSSNKEEIKKYRLEKNTVLFNRTNSPELVGKTAIYLGERAAIFAGYLIRINNMDILDSHYLNYSLNTDYAKAFCNREKTDGVNQSNINAQKLGRFEIPLPPLEEQKEIVRQVEWLFALADKLEAHYQNARARVDKLTRSVLAKAFRGELAPRDPNDEPAEKLLERILAEKEKMAAAGKKNPKKSNAEKSQDNLKTKTKQNASLTLMGATGQATACQCKTGLHKNHGQA